MSRQADFENWPKYPTCRNTPSIQILAPTVINPKRNLRQTQNGYPSIFQEISHNLLKRFKNCVACDESAETAITASSHSRLPLISL